MFDNDHHHWTELNFTLLPFLPPSTPLLPRLPRLQSRHRFVLPVRVVSRNDPPRLQLPPGEVLRLAAGTTRSLTPEVINVLDSDTPPAKLR